MVAYSKNVHLTTPQAVHPHTEKTIVCVEYEAHRILAAQRKEVINSLPDGNNEAIIANINREFAEKQQSEATVLLNKTAFLRDAVRATGICFHTPFKTYSVEVSESDGSTLVILNGIPLDLQGKATQDDAIDLAITKETYVLYTR